MLRKVKLYGELADFIGHKELDAVINCTADAIRFLITNFEGLEAHMANRHYQVLVGDEDIDETELHNPIGKSDISIVPVIAGAWRWSWKNFTRSSTDWFFYCMSRRIYCFIF